MRLRLCLVLAGVVLVVPFVSSGSAIAAACDNSAPFGTASAELSTLPDAGKYSLWSRMQASDSSRNRFQLEINDTCFTVGGDGVSATDWEWVNFQNGNEDNNIIYDFKSTTDNTIRLFGVEQGVRVDSILFINNGCTPIEVGENCRSTGALQLTGSKLGPTNFNTPVNGIIALSSLVPGSSIDNVKIEYYSDGKKVQETTKGEGFDTTLVTNGSHNITTKVTYANGTTENTRVSLVVANEENAFSPVVRWMKLNKYPLRLAASMLGVISVLGITYGLMRRRHLKNHHARTHGYHH